MSKLPLIQKTTQPLYYVNLKLQDYSISVNPTNFIFQVAVNTFLTLIRKPRPNQSINNNFFHNNWFITKAMYNISSNSNKSEVKTLRSLTDVDLLIIQKILTCIGNFLIVNEAPQKSDVIIILAGDSGNRVIYGSKLYQSGYSNKVVLSGGGRYMMKQALSQGIPESSILLENQSRTTFENAKYSLKIVQDQGYKSAIVVTSPYHTHRASMIFRQFFKGINLTICPVPYDPAIRQSWWKDGNSREFVVSEYLKLVWHYLFEWH